MKAYVSQNLYQQGQLAPGCLFVDAGKIVDLVATVPEGFTGPVEDFGQQYLLPGIVDTHVHINEPGRTEWEGFTTATQAAAAGGITTVVDMPLNCIPVTTSAAALAAKLETVRGQLWTDVGFWGGVTAENFANLDELLDSGILGVKSFLIDSGIPEFSWVNFEQVAQAMPQLAERKMPYLFHAEWADAEKVPETTVKTYQDFVATRPNSWEDQAIAKLIELSRQTGCQTHIVHLASASALPDLAAAKRAGIPMTAETCPHYLLFAADELDRSTDPKELPLYKCCPPIRESANNQSLWQGLKEETIDFVVSDHSPCTAGLKRLDTGDLAGAWGGVSGLQFGFGLMAKACEKHGIAFGQLVDQMTRKPALWAGLGDRKGQLQKGFDADFFLWDPTGTSRISPASTLYRNKLHAYNGRQMQGRVVATYLRGKETLRDQKPVPMAPGQPLMRNP